MNTRIFCRPKHCRVQTRVLHCNQLSLTQSRQNFDIIISTSLTGPRPFMWKPERESCVLLWHWGEIAWNFLFFYSPFTILASFYLSFLFLYQSFFYQTLFCCGFFLKCLSYSFIFYFFVMSTILFYSGLPFIKL